MHILKDEEFRPQIRYGKCSEGLAGENTIALKYNYVGKGATAVLPILIFLDHISDIQRKVFVLLDGDEEGEKVYNQINQNEYSHLKIEKYIIPKGREIEDMVFSKEEFIDSVIDLSEDIKSNEQIYREVMNRVRDGESFINQTEKFIELHRLVNVKIPYIKHHLSINLTDKTIKDEWIIEKLHKFFYQD